MYDIIDHEALETILTEQYISKEMDATQILMALTGLYLANMIKAVDMRRIAEGIVEQEELRKALVETTMLATNKELMEALTKVTQKHFLGRSVMVH